MISFTKAVGKSEHIGKVCNNLYETKACGILIIVPIFASYV